MIPELILSLLKSSIIANIISSFIDETSNVAPKTEEETESSTIKLNMPNSHVILIDNDIKLNSHFSGIFTISPEINHIYFNDLSISFSEQKIDFAPIFDKINLEIGIRQKSFMLTLNKIDAYVSSTDIIDIMNFVDKVMNLYSNFSHQLDYSNSPEDYNQLNEQSQIENICFVNNQIVLEFCEDNRTTKIPFPFIKPAYFLAFGTNKPCPYLSTPKSAITF